MSAELLPAVLVAMIPADAAYGLPSAAEIGFERHADRHAAWPTVDAFLAALATATPDFMVLDEKGRLGAILALRQKELRVFSAFLSEALRAYYASPEVLRRIGSGSVPPFPDGNPMPDDDWSLLEPVFERGYGLR